MRSNKKHTTEELETYIQMYVNEGVSYRKLRNEYGLLLSDSGFIEKVSKYQKHGRAGIQSKPTNNCYSEDFKRAVVNEYMEKGVSINKLARKYNIPSTTTVRGWIIKYTKDNKLETYFPKSEVYTMKGRKTTHEEKINIVKDYLTNNLS